jgi:hypothetical protein
MRHIFVLTLPLLACASLLTPDAGDFCAAYGNGTTFNITSLPWPFTFSDARGYNYTLQSPCAKAVIPCPQHDGAQNVVLCQKDHITAGEYFSCGLPTPAMWLLPDAWGTRRWSILFGGGDSWRVANVSFTVDAAVDPPTAVFLGEQPYLQYNVLITGKCIGQPGSTCAGSTPPEFTKPEGY